MKSSRGSADNASGTGVLGKSVLSGLVIALLVVVAGAVLALQEHKVWTAQSVLVMLPNANLNAADSAAYYETMSRGQIVATFAEVADNLRFEQQAEETLGLTEAARASVTTSVTVVPNTSVILIQSSADTAALAEQVADGTASLSTAYLAGLSKPYRTDVVHAAKGSAYTSSTSPTLLLSLGILVALIAGLAVQQAVYHLVTARDRSRTAPAQRSAQLPNGAVPNSAAPIRYEMLEMTRSVRPNGSPVRPRPGLRQPTSRDDGH